MTQIQCTPPGTPTFLALRRVWVPMPSNQLPGFSLPQQMVPLHFTRLVVLNLMTILKCA